MEAVAERDSKSRPKQDAPYPQEEQACGVTGLGMAAREGERVARLEQRWVSALPRDW